jgi:hypothetical protein
MPFLSTTIRYAPFTTGVHHVTTQAGLLAPGSFVVLRLPIVSDSGIMQPWFPVTAAGPRWILTIFPIKTQRVAWLLKRVYELPRCVKEGS